MSHDKEPAFETLKNESTRQRWELFHRAIAHAKQSNISAMQETENSDTSGQSPTEEDDKPERTEPLLSIAR